MKFKLKNVAMALLVGVSLGASGLGGVAYADNNSTLDALAGISQLSESTTDEGKVKISIPQSDQAAMAEVAKKVDGKQDTLQSKDPSDSTGLNSALFSVEKDKVTFDSASFSKASEKSAKQNMKVFTQALTNSQVSPETQQYIFDAITGANPDASVILIPMLMDSTKADIYSAMRIVEPFLSFMRVVFGLGAIVIVLLLATSTIVDLCYIGLPMCRGEEDGKPKIPFVSLDAESVVKEIASNVGGDGKYKNAYIMYFKRRALTYIILAVCLLYLVAGELGGVISWFLNLASGLV